MGVVTQQVWDNDKKRVEQLKMGGKQVYVIWETSWKINKNNIIKDLNRLYEDKRGDKAKKD